MFCDKFNFEFMYNAKEKKPSETIYVEKKHAHIIAGQLGYLELEFVRRKITQWN